MKNLLNSVMLFLLLFVGQNAWSAVVASGDLTSTITWSVEQTGTDSYTLNITGYGDMPDYSGLKDMPWAKCQSAYGVTTNYNSMITELNIDSRITKIGRRTFVKAESITSVTIPENCVSIGQEAFRFCSGLKEIYIPSSVTSIGTDAFSNCRSLDLIHYDGRCNANTGIAFSNVAAAGKIIEKSGTGTSYANVPEGWEYYTHGEQCTRKAWVAENASGDKLFIYGQNPGARVNYAASGAVSNTDSPEYHPWRVNCWKYKSLEINRNVSVIESNELCGYSDNGVGKEGFASLETITVESGNESFVVGEDGALYNAAMTSIRLYPVTNTATHIDIPSTITSIGSGAFYATKNLQSVTFHANSLYFGQYSFARTSLNFIYFDTSQASLSWSATSFTGVAEEGVVAANGETNAFKNFTSMIGSGWTFDGETYGPARTYISDDILYVVGKGEYTTSSSNADWYSQRSSIKKIVVKEGITDIGGSAFANCSNVTEATLNNNGKIGYSAFKDCSALTRVNIGGGVNNFDYSYRAQDAWHYTETVDAFPFEGCSKLATINVTDLASYCPISNLKYLTDREFGTASVKTLMVNGTTHSSTSELVIPENVSSISPYAFRYFSNVTKIKLPSKMTEIASSNFYGHTYLTEITVPSTVSSVGSSAFSGCTSLKTAILNNNGDIGYSAFSGCTALQTVTLNNNGYVDYYAFKDCSALTRINIGSGVSAFKSYSYLNSDFLTVHCYPFSGCSKLATINVTDLVSFNKILDLGYLTNSDYGTAEKKTLMINGEGVWGDEILYLPEEITSYNNSALRYFSNVQRISLPSTMTTVSGFNDHSYLTHVTLSSKVESVTKNAFANCSNLKRIVCLATTCPSTTGSIATEPSSITLKVPYGTASLYKAADVWKEFNVEGGKQYVYDIDIDVLQSVKLSNLHNILTTEKALSWNSSNTAVATVNDGVVTGTNFVYDGSTLQPAKYVKITAELEDGDSYFCGVHVTPKEVALTDGNAYRLATDLEAEKISYTRSFSKAGAWQALYLPFAFDVEEYKSDFDIAEIYAICPTNDTNGDGVLDSNDDKKFILAPLNTGSTQPNAPYMIRPKAAKSYTIVSENTTLASAEINEVEFATSRTQYSVKGIYAADFYAVPGDNNIYVTASGGFGYAKTKNVNIKPNRWVLHEESKNYCSSTSNSNSKLANFTIEVLGEDLDETTAIKLINGETASEGAKNGSAYNLNGMKVDASKNLPSGLYIINGKKVFKK